MIIGLPNLYDKFLIARFIAIAIGLAMAFLFAFVRKKRWVVPNSLVFNVYLLFVLLCGCSIIWATNTAEAIFAFARLLLTPLVIILFYSLLSIDKHLTQKALWMGAAVVLSVYLLFAIVQLSRIENFSYEQLYHVCGINGHKNLVSTMLFLLSAFLLTSFSVFEKRHSKAPHYPFPVVFSVVLFAIAVTVIVLLKSRAVLLGIIVAMTFFGITTIIHRNSVCISMRIRKITLFTSIFIAYAFLAVGLRWFADRSVPHSTEKSEIETKMMSTSSLVERCELWDKTYRIADKHPWAGCGIGNWQIHFPEAGLEGLYRADVWNVNFTKPHNEYLGSLSEMGYPGLLLYTIFLVSLVINAFFALCETKDKKDFHYGTVVLSVFVGCSVNALFDFPNSRIEHIVWMGILMAILFHIIARNQEKTIRKGWNIFFLLVSALMIALGCFRYKGERNAYELQKALQVNDWKAVERYCQQAQSLFYTIDPVGMPLYWYQGKAEKNLGNSQAINSFRKAYHYAPYCKENLNDLGLAEYYVAHDLGKAELYLNEGIRISPNYLYPYFNLAYIYLSENELEKARAIIDRIYFDEQKLEVMKADAVFFEPFNTEFSRQKIDADYEAYLILKKAAYSGK